jgi:hypothetical protein
VEPLLDLPGTGQFAGQSAKQLARIDPAIDGDKRGPPQFRFGLRQDLALVGHAFVGKPFDILRRTQRPAAHRNFRQVIHLVIVDRVALVRLPPHFPEIARVEPFLARVPILEAAIGPGEIRIVEIARVKRVIERGRGFPVEDHVAHRQQVHIPHQQHIADLVVPPLGVKIPLELLRRVHARRRFKHFLQGPPRRGLPRLLPADEFPQRVLQRPRGNHHHARPGLRGRSLDQHCQRERDEENLQGIHWETDADPPRRETRAGSPAGQPVHVAGMAGSSAGTWLSSGLPGGRWPSRRGC